MEVIQKTLHDQRQRFYDLRQIWNAMLWLVWVDCQWRALSRAWQLPWQYFRNGVAQRWKLNALFEQLKDELLIARRLQEERKTSPSAIAVDSQSVKVTAFVCEETGIDGNKRLKGRKHHLVVGGAGLSPLAVLVTGADVSDTEAGKTLADRVATKLTDWSPAIRFPLAWRWCEPMAATKPASVTRHPDLQVGGGYSTGCPAQESESVKGFVPQSGRWQVERSYGWLNFRRRLSRDYQKTVESSEAMLHLVFISSLLPKIATLLFTPRVTPLKQKEAVLKVDSLSCFSLVRNAR